MNGTAVPKMGILFLYDHSISGFSGKLVCKGLVFNSQVLITCGYQLKDVRGGVYYEVHHGNQEEVVGYFVPTDITLDRFFELVPGVESKMVYFLNQGK